MPYRIPPPEARDHLLTVRQRLSRRAVKRTVRIGQAWSDHDGHAWSVSNIHRKDGCVELSLGPERRSATFAELGRHYQPPEERARGP